MPGLSLIQPVLGLWEEYPMWFHSWPGMPVALVVDGELRPNQLSLNKLTAPEFLQAIHGVGPGHLSGAAAVVLETNGALSVAPATSYCGGSALEGVLNRPERRGK